MMTTKNAGRFPIKEVSRLAEKESWRKEVNRPVYHIHKYWAQRLGTVFRSLLLYLMLDDGKDVWSEFYSKQNFSDFVILDPFMGSGTTLGEALKLGTKVIGCDINPVSTFMVRQEFTKVSVVKLYEAYKNIERDISQELLKYYKTLDPSTGYEIPVLYYFWVKMVTTPSGEEIPLFSRYVFAQNAYASRKPEAQILCPQCWGIFEGKYNDTRAVCPHCGHVFNPQQGPANNTTVTDSKGNKLKIKDLVPKTGKLKEKLYALLAVNTDNEKMYMAANDYDVQLYMKASYELDTLDLPLPNYEVRAGYNTDQVRGYNYFNWRDFFNDRQLLCLGKLLNRILQEPDRKIREQLICLFSSTLEYNNTFCSYKGEGTGAVRPIFSNHILKPERTPLENSVWGYSCSSGCFSSLFKSRLLKAKEYLDEPFELSIDEKTGRCSKVVASEKIDPCICNDWDELSKGSGTALILNGNSSELPLPDEVVDFVVTDPPYFDFIHYSELSDFFYAWLSPVLKGDYNYFEPTTAGRKNEVQQTDAAEFTRLLEKVYRECFRVLKPEGRLAFSFHHSRPEGWISIATAIKLAGFYVEEYFPVHAELMASTPKASAKEPICLDAMIICSKIKMDASMNDCIHSAIEFIALLTEDNKRLSKADIFVVSSASALKLLVANDFSTEEQADILTEIYTSVLAVANKNIKA